MSKAQTNKKAAAVKPPATEGSDTSTPVLLPSPTAPWRQEPEYEGKDLFIAFPSYKFTNPATAWLLVQLALDLGRERMTGDIAMGDAMIYHARNVLADKFLKSPCNWMFFLDDDVIPPTGRPHFFKDVCRLPDDYDVDAMSLHVIHRLISHKRTLVGATYFERNAEGLPVNSLRDDSNYLRDVMNFGDTIHECDWMGTGCMLIHRSVFEAIKEKFPELQPDDDEAPFEFFRPGMNGNGEDVAFCERAFAAGHQPFVDAALQAQHVGWNAFGKHNTALSQE